LTSPDNRREALGILDEGMANVARARELALLLGVGLTTLQRWRRQFARYTTASTVARAATATWLTALAMRNASGSCSPATRRDSPHCRRDRSCRCSRTGACISAQSTVSTWYSTRMARPIAVAGRGRHRSPEQFHASGPQVRISSGAGTSPISPPPWAGSGCTSTW